MNTTREFRNSLPPKPELPEILSADIYQELRKLAAIRLAGQAAGQTLQPTALVHEAWLRMQKQDRAWQDSGHFLAAATIVMRHIVIDQARRKARIRHGGDHLRAGTLTLGGLPAPERDEMLLLLDEGISELEKNHPDRARVVVSRFFGGLSNSEIAEILGIGERSVERHWALAKVWLFRWIRENTERRGP